MVPLIKGTECKVKMTYLDAFMDAFLSVLQSEGPLYTESHRAFQFTLWDAWTIMLMFTEYMDIDICQIYIYMWKMTQHSIEPQPYLALCEHGSFVVA